MKIMFLPLITRGSALGSISRCLAMAEVLREQGHQTLFLTNSLSAEHVELFGFNHLVGAMPSPPGDFHLMHDLADVAVYLKLTEESYIRQALDHEWEAVEMFRPDVLVSEFKLTAPITAARASLPLVSTACTPAMPGFQSCLYRREPRLDHTDALSGFNEVLSGLGQEAIDSVAELFYSRSQVKLAPTSPELEPALAEVPDLHYVGYLLHHAMERGDIPLELQAPAREARLVFVYLSSGEIGPKAYTKVLPPAFAGTRYHVAVATGDHPDLPDLPPNTDNVFYYRFLPGMSMLEASCAYISHGGQNSVVSAMLTGTPSLLFPGGDFERYFNARQAAGLGAAKNLPSEDFNPDKLRRRIDDLLQSSCAQDAAAAGGRLRSLGGPHRAAELILQAANSPSMS
jgi:UDP:flavonoid glycosyltransferase YjiC (YdhE family)